MTKTKFYFFHYIFKFLYIVPPAIFTMQGALAGDAMRALTGSSVVVLGVWVSHLIKAYIDETTAETLTIAQDKALSFMKGIVTFTGVIGGGALSLLAIGSAHQEGDVFWFICGILGTLSFLVLLFHSAWTFDSKYL